MSKLVVDIDMSASGNGDAFVLDGWAEPEATHRWTMGRESRLTLPVDQPGPDCVLVIDATPCRNPPALTGQTVMLAIDGRLLATVHFDELRALAFRLPRGLADTGRVVLSIAHLSGGLPRAPEQIRRGQALGLMVHSVRVFRLATWDGEVASRDPVSGAGEVECRTGLNLHDLAMRFESIGQGCQFGLVQRQCGAEPLGLLRFVDTTTSHLTEGLVTGFQDIGSRGQLDFRQTADPLPSYRWHHRRYGLMFNTGVLVGEADPDDLARRHARRLAFLQRKFIEDRQRAEKICVLTRGDCMTEEEALAVYCALRLVGPNVLLWTVFGDPARAGSVEHLLPGFLRGELGDVTAERYGAFDAWLSIMVNAVLMEPTCRLA